MFRYVVAILLLPILVTAGDYKSYSFSRQQTEYVELRYYHDTETIVLSDFTQPTTIIAITGPKNSFKKDRKSISLNGQLIISDSAFHIEGRTLPFEKITDSRITYEESSVTVTFLTKEETQNQPYRLKRGNLISTDQKTIVDSATFIRGMIFNPFGSIEINGEVSKDVISFFGNIKIGDNAVVRGDVLSLTGKISSVGVNSIYGVMFEPFRGIFGKDHLTDRTGQKTDIKSILRYNRVDGLHLGANITYTDNDSIIPTLYGEIGYAFESERLRFTLSAEQTILKDPHLTIGGSFYQQLLSEDTFKITEPENSLFALFITEDFRDYYEALGGTIYFNARPQPELLFSLGYTYYETNWHKAHQHLWSLFGGDKLFDHNYGSVTGVYRSVGITEIDQSQNGYIFATARYYTIDEKHPYETPGWSMSGYFEYAADGLNSDFSYNRYLISARRIQPVNDYSAFDLSLRFGNSDGYLPMYKRFFVGGLSSLHGYLQKEYMGTRFWQSSTEYRFRFPRSSAALGLTWELAQMANDTKLDSDIEIKQSLGFSFYFGNSLKVTVAKRLDRGHDDHPKIYLRMASTF